MIRSAERDFHDGLQIHGHPGLFADVANADFDFSQRRLDRGGPVAAGDGERSASDKTAGANGHVLIAGRATARPADNHRQ